MTHTEIVSAISTLYDNGLTFEECKALSRKVGQRLKDKNLSTEETKQFPITHH